MRTNKLIITQNLKVIPSQRWEVKIVDKDYKLLYVLGVFPTRDKALKFMKYIKDNRGLL